jgi:hypothetical protein
LREAAHRDRRIDLGLHADRRPIEPLRGDADDGHRLTVDDQRLPDDRGIAAEASLPVRVAQHDDM